MKERGNSENGRELREGAVRLSDGALENEFRAMFAERSQSVPMATAPYAAVRRRITTTRRKRRMRIGSAGVAFAVATVGIGVWATASSGHRAAGPVVTPGVSGTVKFVYDDGRTELPNGPLRTAALNYMRPHLPAEPGGLTVVTTFNEAAEKAAQALHTPDDVGIAVVDASTGYVKALAGSWDRPVPIGDTVKPIILAAAFETGHYTPDSKEPLDAATHPITWPTGSTQPLTYYDSQEQKARNWPPERTSTHVQDVDVTLRQATELGANEPFAQVELAPDMMNLGAVRDLAVRMGMPGNAPDLFGVPSLTLGVAEVTPLQMASVYATLAAGGLHRDPVLATGLLGDKGQVVWSPPSTSQRVLSQRTATEVTDVLHSALGAGTTGTDPEARTWAAQGAAAMAGATDGPHSAWFAGYTSGGQVAAVALSRTTASGMFQPLPDAHSEGPELGSRLAGPIWSGIMKALTH
jgi:membrane peptidoglycan carboxypeptidase